MKRHTNSPASVLAQLKNIAKANNVVFAEILNRYAIERILKRIELSSRANQCILKGGCLFILWSDGFSYRMNTLMMFVRAGDECCQCGNVAKSNTNFQCAYDKAAADKFGIGNIGTGNTSTMATFPRLPAALKHGGK